MSAHVLLSDTFDQWRMKTNEWLSMTNSAGSSCSIKLLDTTNSTSNTTGSITTAGGMGLGSSATIGGNLTLHGRTDLKNTVNFKEIIRTLSEDADDFDHLLLEDGSTVDPNASIEGYALIELPNYVDIDGAVQIDGSVTVGVDGTGRDVLFFGDTSAQYMLWDESADELVLAGDTKLSFHDGAGGENIIAPADGHLEVNVGTTLDITAPTVDINATTLNVDGETQHTVAVIVGVDDTGYDVKFFGATSGQYMLWDEDADELVLTGDTKLSFHDAAGDENIIATSDGHLEINAGTTLDITAPTVDINASTAVNVDGTSQINGALTVGSDGSGHDVKFFGATASAYMIYDASSNDLELAGSAVLSIDSTTDATGTTDGSFHTDGGVGIAKKLYVGTDLDVNGTANLDAVDIDGAVQIDGTVTVGVDNTGYDVKFFGASAGAFMLWDESEDTLEIRGPSADATTSTGKLKLSTSLTDINDGDILGSIGFKAPLEAGSGDAILVGASIFAEADATFSSSVNSTDLVFATGDSAAASEKFRIDSTGVCTFADGAIDVDIASHDGTNGLKLGGTLVTALAKDLNSIPNEVNLGQCAAFSIVFAPPG